MNTDSITNNAAPVNDGSREFNAMQRVKRRFFAMRNGAIAQQMADHSGKRYQINFGLNLPQITEIARDFLPGGVEYNRLVTDDSAFSLAEFARKLRENRSTRESMLIAPMLFPVEELSVGEAVQWAVSSPTPEVADILCMKLLRRHPEAAGMVETLLENDGEGKTKELAVYAGLRLMLNLLIIGKLMPEDAAAMMHDKIGEEAERNPLNQHVLRQIRQELTIYDEGEA